MAYETSAFVWIRLVRSNSSLTYSLPHKTPLRASMWLPIFRRNMPSCPAIHSCWWQVIWKWDLENASIGDESIEVQRPEVAVVGRGPTKIEFEHHVALGHAQHRTWCDACMRSRGIAGRHERQEPGWDDEDPPVAIDYGYLKLDAVHFGCEMLWKLELMRQLVFVSLLCRLGYRRAMLQSDGEPSIVALKTATLLASHLLICFCEWKPNWRAASKWCCRVCHAWGEALKFALEAQSPIPPWSGYRRWQQMRSVYSGLRGMAWRLRCDVLDVGRREQLHVECNQRCMLDGILDIMLELAAFSSWPLMESWNLQGFEGWTRSVDGMSTIRMLFVVSLLTWMKGEQKLQRLSKPHDLQIIHLLLTPRRRYDTGQTWGEYCDDRLLCGFWHNCSREDIKPSHGGVSK